MWRSSSNNSRVGRSHHNCVRCPNTTPIRRTCSTRCRYGTRPSTTTRPLLGTRMPVSIFIVVDLPAPLGPIYPTISPSFTRNETSSTATTVCFSRASSVRSVPQRPPRRPYFVKTLRACSTSIKVPWLSRFPLRTSDADMRSVISPADGATSAGKAPGPRRRILPHIQRARKPARPPSPSRLPPARATPRRPAKPNGSLRSRISSAAG